MREPTTNIRKTTVLAPGSSEHELAIGHALSSTLRDSGVERGVYAVLCPGSAVGFANPVFHTILYSVGGEGRLSWHLHQSVLREGEVAVVPAGQGYRYEPVAGTWRTARFHCADTERWAQIRGAGVRVSRSAFAADIAEVVGLYVRTQLIGSALAAQRADCLGRLLVSYLMEDMVGTGRSGGRSHDEVLAGIQRSVGFHPDIKWSVQRLARQAAMSPSHFAAVAKARTGLAPMQLVTRMRMERVKELLLRTGYPLKTIAPMVGYTEPFALSAAFRRHAGMSPRAFRESARTSPSGQ